MEGKKKDRERLWIRSVLGVVSDKSKLSDSGKGSYNSMILLLLLAEISAGMTALL